MSRLQERLISRAAELNISQTELAERTGALQQSISALFNGESVFPDRWEEIAKALEIDEQEMIELMMEAAEQSGKTKRIPRKIKMKQREFQQDTTDRLRQAFPEAFLPNARIIRGSDMTASGRPSKMLPVYGQAVGGVDGKYVFNGSVLDWVVCPPSLEGVPGAYAVYIDGESMSPRYRPGETVWVHPHKPARRGDDVIVQIRPDDEGDPPNGFVKELVGWAGDRLVLRQHNPQGELSFRRGEVVSIHPIVLSGKY